MPIMKKTILALLTPTMIGAGIQTAKAGDCEWALAGKVLTGLAVASVIGRAMEPTPVHSCSPNSYAYSKPADAYGHAPAPTPVCLTPPTVVYATPTAVVYAPVMTRVVAYRQPVYVAPAAAVSFRFNAGLGHYQFRRRCW
jgi:hypothetical protein